MSEVPSTAIQALHVAQKVGSEEAGDEQQMPRGKLDCKWCRKGDCWTKSHRKSSDSHTKALKPVPWKQVKKEEKRVWRRRLQIQAAESRMSLPKVRE